jgi:hypothetical protein
MWVIIIFYAILYFSCEKNQSREIGMDQKITELTTQDIDHLDAQRLVITKYLADEESCLKYKEPEGKLGTLRALIENKVFKKEETYKLQCMGIVLGDVFVQKMGFTWVIVEDENGRDPALKYRNTSIILYPLTMISKRVEKGEDVDVFELYNGIANRVEEMIKSGY